MDKSSMATTQAVTTPAYPKRKRKEISYKESSSDESEVDDEYDESDGVFGTRGKKVRYSMPASFGVQVSSNNLL